MSQDSALSPWAWEYLKKVKAADILVGIPSYNNAHTINYVVYQAAKGLETYFPELKPVIFVSDGNSNDGTLGTVKAMQLPFQTRVIPVTYVGVPGKGSAVKAIFEAAKFLGVRAVALVDSDLRSITPEWMKLMISPLLSGTGLVTPFYIRHKYDGTITNFLCYPLTSSLYGKKIRQPIGGDFGLSISLARELLNSSLWRGPYVRRFGIDIFITHTALAKGFDVKQAFLESKVHEAKDPSKDLAPMFRQVLGSMFACIQRYKEVWTRVHGLSEVAIVAGKEHTAVTEPEPVRVDPDNMMKAYKDNFNTYKGVYRTILSEDLLKVIEDLKKMSDATDSFPAEIWAKIVYSFIATYSNSEQSENEHLIDALRILWIGKVGSFIRETLNVNTFEAEEKIKEEAKIFERLKPYLLNILQ